MLRLLGLSLPVFMALAGQSGFAAEKVHAEASIAMSKYAPADYDATAETKLVLINVEESFSGDIQGTGTARFLQAVRSDGSASFVGMERFVGRVGGKKGTFILQDAGTLTGDQVSGSWFVVPGSGSGELAGITGDGGFKAKLGQHASVRLDYSFEK